MPDPMRRIRVVGPPRARARGAKGRIRFVLSYVYHGLSRDDVFRRSAALAYYAVFSVAPLLVVSTAVAIVFFGRKLVEGELRRQLLSLLGEGPTGYLTELLSRRAWKETGIVASAIGVSVSLLGASGVVVELGESIQRILAGERARRRKGVLAVVMGRIGAFLVVLSLGGFLIASVVLSAVLSSVGTAWDRHLPGGDLLMRAGSLLIPPLLFAGLISFLYRFLSDPSPSWKHCFVGACVAAGLLVALKVLLGFYLARFSAVSVFGAAGSLAVLLLWANFSSLAIFIGAEVSAGLEHSVA